MEARGNVALLFLLSLSFGSISASGGPIGLNSPADFQNALNEGYIQPVTAWDSTLEFHYPGESNLFSVVQLSVSDDGLAVNLPDGRTGALLYTFPEDPPVGSVTATINYNPAKGSNTSFISLTLGDANQEKRSWTFTYQGSGQASININTTGGQQSASSYDPGFGFDDKNVTSTSIDFARGTTGTIVNLGFRGLYEVL